MLCPSLLILCKGLESDSTVRLGVRGEGEEYREAPKSAWDLDSGNVIKGLVERLCVVGVKPHLACAA